jgi:cysteinyl-tRNA synthetase
MVLKLYNTLSRKKEVFKPLEDKKIKMYSCGPTVYWYQHIGNMRYALFVDLIKRVLLYNDYKIKHVMNITDVGHLTSDADEGEDKMVKAIKREGLKLNKESMLVIAKKYTDIFLNDVKKLNVVLPDVMPKATEHIKEMIEVIKKIEKKGYAYKTSVGLIFDTAKFKDYGKLAKLNPEQMKFGERVEVDPERKNPTDFALWITNQPNHIMQWDSPWGKGFPGWHIECSAMSWKYLGEQFDIHTGGEEHIPVHHTNEIAQSETAFGKKPWVKYWLHLRWLKLKGGKMSKSLGNVYTLSDLEEKKFSPLSFRYLCLLTHYRKPLEFSFESLTMAQNSYERLKNIVLQIKDSEKKVNKKNIEAAEKQFLEIINDDLNSPKALSFFWDIIRDERLNDSEKYELAVKFDKVFGLDLGEEEKIKIPEAVKKIIEEREDARKNKEWKKSDELRDKIKKLGFAIDDTKEGYKIRKI